MLSLSVKNPISISLRKNPYTPSPILESKSSGWKVKCINKSPLNEYLVKANKIIVNKLPINLDNVKLRKVFFSIAISNFKFNLLSNILLGMLGRIKFVLFNKILNRAIKINKSKLLSNSER